METNKKLSHTIDRTGYLPMSYKFTYNYKFDSQFILEDIELLGGMLDQNDVKQSVIDNLLIEFKCSLNNIIFGDAAGRYYIENKDKL